MAFASEVALINPCVYKGLVKAASHIISARLVSIFIVSFSPSLIFIMVSVLSDNSTRDLFLEKCSIVSYTLTTPPSPIPNSYWATPLVCASEYPFSPFHFRPQLDKLLRAGIRTFIDLTEPNELIPYESRLRARARAVGIPDSVQLWYYRFPIRDRSIPSEDGETMKKIMSVLQQCELANRKAVVHCRGGIGRTGTVIGCWLVQSGRVANGEIALQTIKKLWKKVEKCKRYPHSPETGPQCEFVRKFGGVILDAVV